MRRLTTSRQERDACCGPRGTAKNRDLSGSKKGTLCSEHESVNSVVIHTQSVLFAADHPPDSGMAPSAAVVVAAAPAGVSFNSETNALCIDGIPVKIFYFGDEPTMPRFQAKPVHNCLGATKIGQTLARVSDEM